MGINCDTDILGLFCMCVQWLDWMDYPVIVSRWCAIGEVYCRWVILRMIVMLAY